MKIGVIGSGHIGGNLGKLWAAAGHQILFSSRHPQKLRSLIADVNHGALAGTVHEAAQFGEIILFSPPYEMTDEALTDAGELNEKIVIDATNPFLSDKALSVSQDHAGVSELVRKIPKARVIKAFNTLYFQILADQHHLPTDRRVVITYCGNDAYAKDRVARLIENAGFVPFDLGPLSNAWLQEPGGPFFDQALSQDQADRLMRSLGAPIQEAA